MRGQGQWLRAFAPETLGEMSGSRTVRAPGASLPVRDGPFGRAERTDTLANDQARAFLHAVPAVQDDGALVELYSEASLPTRHGLLRTYVFRERGTGKEHVAAVKGDVHGAEGVPVRVHSECLTSEILGSLKCDCRDQLEHALDLIGRSPAGAVLYLRQEGRGIGLGNKIRAYALQARGADTYEANRALGFADDLRRYDIAASMIKQLGIKSVDLITNNPLKIAGLENEGVVVKKRIPSVAPLNPHNAGYLRTKRERTGHLIELLGA
jgi:GTP cyclohydrolase II/3,4-dihydroxy 2-butanone 4-phosphate synthase/GTP cyclohydrolase II